MIVGGMLGILHICGITDEETMHSCRGRFGFSLLQTFIFNAATLENINGYRTTVLFPLRCLAWLMLDSTYPTTW